MNEPRSFFEELLYTTVPLTARFPGGTVSSGTGFFYSIKPIANDARHIPYLVTNRHVVEGCIDFSFRMKPQIPGEPFLRNVETITLKGDIWLYPDDINIDIAVMEVGRIFNILKEQEKYYHFVYRSQFEILPDDKAEELLDAVEEVYFPGYPQGLGDQYNNIPLIRKGCTSTPYYLRFNGEEKFLIDAETFPGSSGSPVCAYFHAGHIAKNGMQIQGNVLLGILTGSLLESQSRLPVLGIGVVQKVTILQRFIESILLSQSMGG